MAVTDTTTVLEVLRTFPVKGNRMVLGYEVPQPVYRTFMGRTFRDEQAEPLTEGEIIGYSVYRGANANGDYSRVVAHKGDSHVMHIIAVKTNVELNDEIVKALKDFFSVTELLDNGGDEEEAGRLLMMYLGKSVNWPTAAEKEFVEKHSDKLEKWLPRLTTTPYMSKFNTHEMCTIGKHSTIEEAIRAHDKLHNAYFF